MRRRWNWRLAVSVVALSGFALLKLAAIAQAGQTQATRTFGLPCSELKPAAVSFFRQRGLILNPDASCEGCLIGTTGHLMDARGHAVSTRAAMKRYMDPSGGGKNAFGSWRVHGGLETTAKLALRPAGDGGCTAELLFFYLWYAAQFHIAMPVNGDRTSRPSNLRLETEYLQGLADTQTPAKPH